jgi:Pyruvate/2-oxoacid:ferredoxin oxidoreductase delta subunit
MKAKLGRWQVQVQEQACSLCGACAQWCGPAALSVRQADGAAVLGFAAESCPGCGICVDACPEKALALRELPPPQLAVSVASLASSPLARCSRYGTPSVPDKMLGSLSRWSLAPGEAGAASGADGAADYTTCLACRSDMMFGGAFLSA